MKSERNGWGIPGKPVYAWYGMTNYYFDTSAFARFFDHSDARLDSLSTRLKNRADVLVISEVLLTEVAPPAHAEGRIDLLRRQLGFIEKMPHRNAPFNQGVHPGRSRWRGNRLQQGRPESDIAQCPLRPSSK